MTNTKQPKVKTMTEQQTNGTKPDVSKIPYMAAEFMGKSMLDLILQELKAAPDVWQKMSQKQQDDVIGRARNSIQYAVAGAVNTITTQNQTSIGAVVDGIAKKDKIKLTLLVPHSNDSESLMNLYQLNSGATVRVLLGNAEPYIGGMELVVSEPDQRELFAESAIPDDDLLWAVNLPIMRGDSAVFPAPTRKDAEVYARSIREKLLEKDSVFSNDCAKHVFSLPWIENAGEHTRAIQSGKWEALINWYVKLKNGELDIDHAPMNDEPVALIKHVSEDVSDNNEHLIVYREIKLTILDRIEACFSSPMLPRDLEESAYQRETALAYILAHMGDIAFSPELHDTFLNEDTESVEVYRVGILDNAHDETPLPADFKIVVSSDAVTNTARALGKTTSATSSPIAAAKKLLTKLGVTLGDRILLPFCSNDKIIYTLHSLGHAQG